MDKRAVVFVDGVRTAFGRLGGTLKDIAPEKLAGICLKGLLDKTKIMERGHVDSVFMGSALPCMKPANPARWIMLDAGLPASTSASYVEMQCGSAIDSINHAAWKILCNQADIVIAGGVEGLSQSTVRFSTSPQPYHMIPPKAIAYELYPGAKKGLSMGFTAENLQVMYGISREAQDEFAFRSQTLAKKAIDAGYLEEEIIPVMVPQGKKKPPIEFKVDEHPRLVPLDVLAKLPPAFQEGGTVTAGNSSGLNDGSSFVLMMSEAKASELGYQPMAKWLSGADYGVTPEIMGIAPAYAMPMALRRTGLKLSDMDVIECNEAFAVQNLAVIRELAKQTGEALIMDRWNPNGGAIAYGHPNGASGGRLCIFTMRELIRRGGRYGIFSSCCGGGQGVATVIENLRRN